jgi:drug/metabolite transporter (DMT)-like permease
LTLLPSLISIQSVRIIIRIPTIIESSNQSSRFVNHILHIVYIERVKNHFVSNSIFQQCLEMSNDGDHQIEPPRATVHSEANLCPKPTQSNIANVANRPIKPYYHEKGTDQSFSTRYQNQGRHSTNSYHQQNDSLVLIGLSNDDEADCEQNSSSNNSPFHSATEDVGTDGDHDRDPLLFKTPPKQSAFHQFLSSAKNSTKIKISSKSTKLLLKSDRTKSDSPGVGGAGTSSNAYRPSHDVSEGQDRSSGRCSVGIFLAAVSCIFFATSALIVKVSTLHPMELLCARGLLQAIFISPIVISTGNSLFGDPGSRALLLARAVLGAVSLIMSFASIHLIPLADAATLIFTSPVFVSLFGRMCLGEVCSWFDVIMIAFTLLGVILVSQPSFNFITMGSWTSVIGTVCGLAAAMLTALAFIVLRQLKHVHYSVTVFWFSTVLAAFGAVLTVALDGFTIPNEWTNVMECVGIGICGFLGQILLTKALQIENAGPCAVARTLDIVLAFFYQITLLHDTPDWYSYLGSFLVVSCVLLTAFRRWYKDRLVNLQISRQQQYEKSSSHSNRNCNYSRAMS